MATVPKDHAVLHEVVRHLVVHLPQKLWLNHGQTSKRGCKCLFPIKPSVKR